LYETARRQLTARQTGAKDQHGGVFDIFAKLDRALVTGIPCEPDMASRSGHERGEEAAPNYFCLLRDIVAKVADEQPIADNRQELTRFCINILRWSVKLEGFFSLRAKNSSSIT